MPQRDDPLKRRPRAKNREDIEDAIEKRLSGQLAQLMRDPRYLDGDPDYRAYIHRQFRRVYDDPSGKPKTLRIGRPKPFVDELEPFDPARERRLRLGQEKEGPPLRHGTILTGAGRGPRLRQTETPPTSPSTRKTSGAADPSASAQGFDIIPPSERALGELEGNARRHGPDPEVARRTRDERLKREQEDLRRTLDEDLERQKDGVRNDDVDRGEISRRLERTGEAIDAMIASWRRDGSVLGAEFLERYRDGVGGVHPISWGKLMTYSKFRYEQEELKGHYLDWVRGELDDDLWRPFMELSDGESIRVSTNQDGDPLKLTVNWDPVTVGSTFDLNDGKDRDFARAVGQGEIESFGDLTFTRRGEIILVSGTVDMKLNEMFNFEPGILGWLDSLINSAGPSVSNEDLEEYETLGPAKEFLSTSRKIWQVTGRLVLRDDGTPDLRETVLFWSQADREEAGDDA